MRLKLQFTRLAVLASLSFAFTGAPKRTVYNIQHGAKLTYEVDYHGKNYNFIVTIKKTSPEIIFGYEMTAPASKKGMIIIPAKDIDSARMLHNEFSGGSLTLDNETTVFLSRAVYAEIAMAGMNENGATFSANTGEAVDTFSRGEPVKIEMPVNGKKVKVEAEKFYDHVDPVHGNYHYTFTVLRNENFPVIMDMDLGWTIHLKSMDGMEVQKVDE